MKTMINKFILTTIVLALTLPLMASTPSYTIGDQAPTIAFRSTSTMVGSGSTFASTPTLNENGMAYAPYSPATSAAPRHAKNFGPNPDEELDETDKVPIGDELIPLLIIAAIYALWKFFQMRRNSVQEE